MPDFKPYPCLFPRLCLTLREQLMHTEAFVDAANQILLVHTFVA
jgi:hypothetical protein